MFELVLVSESPRRRQILSEAGFLFRVDTVKISEIIEENVNPEEGIKAIARAKVEAYVQTHNHLKYKDILLVSADTMVVLQGRALGKPKNSTEAEQFLRSLSGKKHSVITAVCIYCLKDSQFILFSDKTEVEFRKLSESEIVRYVESGESLDKAGAYAIQGAGGQLVSAVRGSIQNVIGFPIELFEEKLKEKGWNVARHTVTKYSK
ncbi:MAG: septum formation protein Maf [Bdellovibrionales bacterium]|nr:septum formation protein Maf [Bdellovibrionales bacterium]